MLPIRLKFLTKYQPFEAFGELRDGWYAEPIHDDRESRRIPERWVRKLLDNPKYAWVFCPFDDPGLRECWLLSSYKQRLDTH